jgi:hypothetical protein
MCPAFCWRLICDTSDDDIDWHAALGHCTVLPLELPELEPDAPELEPPLLEPLEPPLDPPLDDEEPEPPDPPLDPEGPAPWLLPHARRKPEAKKVSAHAAIRTVMGESYRSTRGARGQAADIPWECRDSRDAARRARAAAGAVRGVALGFRSTRRA